MRSCRARSAPSDATKESAIEPVPIHPALRPGSERYPSATTIVPARGIASASQAKVVALTAAPRRGARAVGGSPLQLPQLIYVDRQAAAVDRDDHAEPDAHLARRHRHHHQRQDLAV